MECKKCHKIVPEGATVCPHCKKVLALECPNCKTLQHNPICEHCGYIILEKCAKCGRLVPTNKDKCKCGYPVSKSIEYNECENDEFASLSIKFNSLGNIRNLLASSELYKKFYTKLNNLLMAQIKGVEGCIITYGNDYVINFNKELSLSASSEKAVRLALKIMNAFSLLNLNVIEELGTSLKLSISITRKFASDLLAKNFADNNLKLLTIKKDNKKYLQGMQVILDQHVRDSISKNYKTDSLYAVEQDGYSTMFYEILLQNYILPPNKTNSENIETVQQIAEIKKVSKNKEDLYSFNVFDIKAKCKFEKSNAVDILTKLDSNTIISLKSKPEYSAKTSDILDFYERQGIKVLHAVCNEENNYKPWGIMEKLFRDYYNLSEYSNLVDEKFDVKIFSHLKSLLFEKPRKASTSEDARFAYMEDFGNFIASLKDCVIFIENFEYMDDTTIQTLELYFDKYQKINTNFIFTTNLTNSVHSKIKKLILTDKYTEFTLMPCSIEELIADIKEDASDFINSFYYEKIKDNFDGSKIYYDNAIQHLYNKGVLINFEGKLLVKNNISVMLPPEIKSLIKSRLKQFAKNMDLSMVLAYSNYFGQRLDYEILTLLGIKDVQKAGENISKEGFGYTKNNVIYINNYDIFKQVLESSLKPEVEEMLIKNILAKLGSGANTTLTLLFMGKIGLKKEQYLMLWKNSQLAMDVGDYDAYLKNCLGFLSILDVLNEDVSPEEIENCKMEVYQNILMSLYSYSPTKIYSIENILLMDAINKNNEEQIIKLSNLMLQGALISANYSDALSLLHNILKKMPNASLIVDGSINTKFLLLSLVNIEILFNIGDYAECIDLANKLLDVITPDILDSVKPASFSKSLFIEHILESFRLVCFAMIISGRTDLNEFIDKISGAIGTEFLDSDCIIAVRDFLKGTDFVPSKTEDNTPFTKLIYLILQEFTAHFDDYKTFAQNIYQAKLLANELSQKQISLLCELLIAYSYEKIGIPQKAEHMYKDILDLSEKSAIFNICILAKYFMAKQKLNQHNIEDSLYIVNDALSALQNKNNYPKLLYILLEKLFIEIIEKSENISIDLISEKQKLQNISEEEYFSRILN